MPTGSGLSIADVQSFFNKGSARELRLAQDVGHEAVKSNNARCKWCKIFKSTKSCKICRVNLCQKSRNGFSDKLLLLLFLSKDGRAWVLLLRKDQVDRQNDRFFWQFFRSSKKSEHVSFIIFPIALWPVVIFSTVFQSSSLKEVQSDLKECSLSSSSESIKRFGERLTIFRNF